METIDIDDAKRQINTAARKKKNQPETSTQNAVGVKMLGAINQGHWAGAFRRKYTGDAEWDLKMAEELSTWEARLKDPFFQQYNMVPAGNGEWKVQH